MKIQAISDILLNEDSPELHAKIIRDMASQGLSTEEARFILSHTNNNVSYRLLSAFAYCYLGDYDNTIHILDNLIADNQIFAITLRARVYYRGQGTPNHQPDYPAAIELLDTAIIQGDTNAMISRAYMHQGGKGTPNNQPDYLAAIELLDASIIQGNTDAIANRACMYRDGQATPNQEPDYPAAIELLDRAIAQGNTRAMFIRACMHRDNQGTPHHQPDYPAAIKLLDRAVAQGDTNAMSNRAGMYHQGQGTPNHQPDYPAAIELLDRAIAQGNTTAMVNRAGMYRDNQGTPHHQPDYPAAIKLLDRAVAQGDTNAMSNRAGMYHQGQGTPNHQPDYPAAIELLDRAIAQGNTTAMVNRAGMYRCGQGTPNHQPDYPAAIELLDRAIAQGNTSAMVRHVGMYRHSPGTLDEKRAHTMNLILQAARFNHASRQSIKDQLTYLSINEGYLPAEYFLFSHLYKRDGYFPQDKNAALDLFKNNPVDHFVSYCNDCIKVLRQDDNVTKELYEHQIFCLNQLQDNIPEHQQTPIVQAAGNRFLAYGAFFISGDVQTAYETFRLIPQEYLSAHDLFELSNLVWMNPTYKDHRDTTLCLAIELANYAVAKNPDANMDDYSSMLKQLHRKKTSLTQKETFQLNSMVRPLNLASRQISELKDYQIYLQEKDKLEPQSSPGRFCMRLWSTTPKVKNSEHLQAVVSTLIEQLDRGRLLEKLIELPEIRNARAKHACFNQRLKQLSSMSFLPALDNEAESLELSPTAQP
ncbi:MAG: tetratricopeptide repeat protein [Legionellaceae bacterium]|nr:tetratricopeptide repeat protein [Legionellaceae bacterium]